MTAVDQDLAFAARAAAACPRPVEPGDLGRLVRLLTDAFEDDPPMRWTMRPAPKHRGAIAAFMGFAAGEQCLPHGASWVAPDFRSCALWLPPERLDALDLSAGRQIQMLPRLLRMVGLRGIPRALAMGEAMRKHHPSAPPHWYLYFLAVDPAMRGRGLGSSILEATLAQVDATGLPAYLDNSNPRNTRLYERFGFKVRSEYRPRADAPPIWGMWRDGR